LLPGLGFDCRIFQNLDFEDFEVEHINWIDPLEGETFHDYSIRIFENRTVKDEKTILIGYSLGGMAAQEIATFYDIEKIIIISSIKSGKENPLHFRIVNPLRIFKLFTKIFCVKSIKYWGKAHGYIREEELALFRSLIMRQSNSYLKWSLRELSIWKFKANQRNPKIFHIHGDSDKTFPIGLIHELDVVVKNGSHLMLYKQPKEISGLVLKELKAIRNKLV
jgi:pimeloyl-ACP methyl ester carboxylesterase